MKAFVMAVVGHNPRMTIWDRPTGDVFVLGAGFSRALSPRLPLTDELGNACLDQAGLRGDARVPASGFLSGTFESWLSGLAEPQPFLSEQANLENQALFLRFSDAIAAVLGERVDEALRSPAPSWLLRFLMAAHCRRATLITFNYDTLIECAVATRGIFQPGYPEPVFWAEILGNVPPWAPGSNRLAATQMDTLRLLKLHGSLNWYWVPGDISGISLARRVLPGAYQAPGPYREEDRQRELPGRVPFVVPPSATKSSYFRNPVVREVWSQAARALREASNVNVFGYSLPVTDTTFTSMLWQMLQTTTASLLVADTRPDGVIARLASLGFDPARLGAQSSAESPIADAAAAFCHQTSATAVQAIQSQARDSRTNPLIVAWAADAYAAVTGYTVQDGDIVMDVEAPAPLGRATRIRPGETLPTLEDVLSKSKQPCAWLLRNHAGELQEVVDWTHFTVDIGYGTGHWNVLTPSGAPTPPSS
jgi:hypothetical protein